MNVFPRFAALTPIEWAIGTGFAPGDAPVTVGRGRIELPPLSGLDPKSSASTSSATCPDGKKWSLTRLRLC